MPRLLLAFVVCCVSSLAVADVKVLPDGRSPEDKRLGKLKDLNGYFPLEVPATKEEWAKRSDWVRKQVLVSQGLWPMPTKAALKPVVHGKVDRDDFTVERVYFESAPGFYVTGSLFRPKGLKGPFAGVLCPHGHWANGRFYDAGEPAVKQQIVVGAERFEVSGRYPLQARCIQLARMGCVVFHYDMLGNADSQQLSHTLVHRFGVDGKRRPEMEKADSWGLYSPQAELRLQSIMGLQTLNSIVALDFIQSLPDVDPNRIGVTGASGGGTQTFMLSAVDPRVTAQFPAVMVSTGMQGGCTCENCSLLRVGTGNIELAGLFAPKPLGMVAADDWTKEIMTKGMPELNQLYTMLGAKDNVKATAYLHFPHNYNQPSRAAMYSWFNKHLKLGDKDPIVERDFQPLSIAELTVFDDAHPKPPSGDDFERSLTKTLATDADKQIAALTPTDTNSLTKFRDVVGTGWKILIGRELPDSKSIEREKIKKEDRGNFFFFGDLLKLKKQQEEVPIVFLHPKQWNKQVVVWVDESGKSGLFNADGSPKYEIKTLLDNGFSVCSPDIFGTGELVPAGTSSPMKNRRVGGDRQFAGFTYGYNHALFAQRVHDILTLISFVRGDDHGAAKVHLVGLNGAGLWVAAAKAIAGPAIDRTAIDTAGFRFASLTEFDDAQFLPGAVKYGDVPALLALSAGSDIWLSGEKTVPRLMFDTLHASGSNSAPSLFTGEASTKANDAVKWLSR
jgi:dienelactone hydrolase